jgi:hypothetical protein
VKSAPRFAFALTVTLAAAVAAPACSSKEPVHPPELGNCIAAPDASCGTIAGSSGGPSHPGGDGSANMDTGILDSGTCGNAATLISTTNVDCLPCIEGADGGQGLCCLVAFACSETSGCTNLLACAEACAANDTTCVDNCENQWQKAVGAYNDFAACIARWCTPECPALPQTTVVDP